MTTLETVKEATSEVLDISTEDIKEDSNFIEDLRADSLDCVEIIIELEDRFDIEILDEDMEKMHTVKDVVTYIEENI